MIIHTSSHTNHDSRSFSDVMLQLLKLVASDYVPDADIRDIRWAGRLLLTCGNKPPVGVHIDALNVIVVAEEEALRGPLLVKELLVQDDANSPSVIDNLRHVPTEDIHEIFDQSELIKLS